MNFKFLILLLPVFLYSYNYDNYLRDKHKILLQEMNLKQQEMNLEYQKYMDRKKARYEAKRDNANLNARIKNNTISREFDYRNGKSSHRDNVSNRSIYVKKEYKPQDFEGKPQLKLGDLHILGITSIKPFKNNKFIIKAANGTFALPEDKFFEAEKINFIPELIKIR